MRLLVAEFAANLCRDAGGEGLRWDLLSLQHKRAGSDERARAHHLTRQQRGLHSNQRASAHVRAQDAAVEDRGIRADFDVANDGRVRSNPGAAVNARVHTVERQNEYD